MKAVAEVISIGDELLIGQVINTNAAWLGEQLYANGYFLKTVTTIGDDENEILKSLENASKRANLVLITGGLGPTSDDITKPTLCKYFNTKLVLNKQVLMQLEQYFDRRGMKLTERNRNQALVPESCTYIPNVSGTAPCMWFEKDNVIYVSMPGVPFETKTIFEKEILPRLKQRFETVAYVKKTIILTGIGESYLADKIIEWEKALPDFMSLAYLPQYGMIRLRLSGRHANQDFLEKAIEDEINKLLPLISEYVFGFENEQLAEVIIRILKERKMTLSTAESCTGGNIAHLITSVPGSSAVFNGTIVSYANLIKSKLLQVDSNVIKTKGAVSQEVVEAMAKGARKNLETDFALATSGIAGPDGGTAEKPVGTVWIALSTPKETVSHCFNFGSDRENNIKRASLTALNMLRMWLLKNN